MNQIKRQSDIALCMLRGAVVYRYKSRTLPTLRIGLLLKSGIKEDDVVTVKDW